MSCARTSFGSVISAMSLDLAGHPGDACHVRQVPGPRTRPPQVRRRDTLASGVPPAGSWVHPSDVPGSLDPLCDSTHGVFAAAYESCFQTLGFTEHGCRGNHAQGSSPRH